VMSYNRLTKESITTWDERLGTQVSHLEFGVLRILGVTIALVLTVLLIFYGVAG